MNSASPSRGLGRARSRCAVASLLASVLALTPSARADEVIIISNKDNTLYESAVGGLSNGAGISMFVGSTNTAGVRRAVVSFDIAASIPVGSIILSATITLQLTQTTIPTQTIELHRLTGDWGEGTSNAPGAGGTGAPSTAGDATWIHRFFDNTFWTTTGGDFSTVVSASQTTGDLGPYSWTSSQLALDVQSMLDNPGLNFGWIFIGDEATDGAADRFATREHPIANFRPMLIVNFAPIPEPGTFALVLIALCVFGSVYSLKLAIWTKFIPS